MRKTQIPMNKPVYLGLSIVNLSKTVIYELCHDYVKPKYGQKAKLCYMHWDSFMFHVKKTIFIKALQKMLKQDFESSNYELNRPLPKGKNKKIIGVLKDELSGKIMNKFVWLKTKTY